MPQSDDHFGLNESSRSSAENHFDPGRRLWVRCIMQVLWPAFLGAAVTVGLLFSLIDPTQIEWVHVHLQDSRQASYTLGFLLFWLLYALSCSLTWYLASTEAPSGRIGRSARNRPSGD